MASWLTALDPSSNPHHSVRLTRHLGGDGDGWWQGFDPEKGCVVIRLDKSISQHVEVGREIWIWNFQENQPNLIHAMASKGAIVVIRPPQKDDLRTGRTVELFSGLGGWAMGGDLMGTKPVISVERDSAVARAAGAQHSLPVYDINYVWEEFLSTGRIELGCIWIADVFDPKVMMMLSVIQVDHFWGSPPCQPWSSMATQAGLSTAEGRYIPETFCLGYKLGVQSITLENVKGFRTHSHYEETMRFTEKVRFCRAQESVDDCTGILPLSRSRWLGCFLSQNALVEHVVLEHIKHARNIHMPEDPFLGGMRGCDAVFHDIPEKERNALVPDEQALSRLNDAKLIPSWWRAKPTTPEETLKARTISPKGPLIGMVASYGRQHEFDYQYLLDKGLHTMLIQYEGGHRYVSPWEQVVCLGFPATTILPSDHTLAWHILGNSLSLAHSLLQLYRSHVILGKISPFKGTVPPLPTLCRKMQRLSLRLSKGSLVEFGDGFVRMGGSQVPDVVIPPIPNPQGDTPDCAAEERQCKRAKSMHATVSPTVPFVVDAPKLAHSVSGITRQNQSRGQGIRFLPAAQDKELDRMLVEADMLSVGDEEGLFRPAAIASKTSRWVHIVWGPPKVEVQSLIHYALPHADHGKIDQIESRGQGLEMRSVMQSEPPHIIRFRPCVVLCQVKIDFANHMVVEEADVTTTVGQWIASFAAKLNVDPTTLTLWGDDNLMVIDAFVLECSDHHSYVIKWRPVLQPCPKHVLHLRESETTWPNPREACGHKTQNAAAELLRFAVVHPLWKSIRTIAVDNRVSIARVIHALLPDIPVGNPIVEVGARIVDPTIEVQAIKDEAHMLVDLNTSKNFPRLNIEIVPQNLDPNLKDWGVGEILAPFKRFVKSPFRVHGHEYKLPGDCTLLKLGATFFCQSEVCQTLLVTCNCRTIDPNVTIRETNERDVINFRATPLPGGAKKELNQFIAKQLQSRGVPKEHVDDRVKQIFDDVPNDQLKAISRDDEGVFWQHLKKLATEHHVRLITNGELKLHQKEQRSKKITSNSENATSSKPAKGNRPKVDITQVKVEMLYLEADDKTPLKLLTPEDFGRDKTGVVLMTVDEASHYMPVKRMSMQPLAILVIAGSDTPTDQVQMLPALDKNQMPILLPIQIVNFGDVNVKLVPGKNAASTTTTVTHVVETIIRKSLVDDWGSTKDPIQYIGKHATGFTGGALVAHFAFKTYGPSKQVVPHDKGQYYHGFLRIKDEPLEEILKSSG